MFIEIIKRVEEKRQNARFYLSYDIKISLKSHFCNKKHYFVITYATFIMDVIMFPENL